MASEKLELTLIEKDGSERKYSRGEATLIEMEEFLKLRKKQNEAYKAKKLEELETFKRQVEFIAFVFRNQKVTDEMIMEGMASNTFEAYFNELCRKISPSHFEHLDNIKERIESAGDKGKSE